MTTKQAIIDLMSDGIERSVTAIIEDLKGQGEGISMQGVYATCGKMEGKELERAGLNGKKKMFRLARGISTKSGRTESLDPTVFEPDDDNEALEGDEMADAPIDNLPPLPKDEPEERPKRHYKKRAKKEKLGTTSKTAGDRGVPNVRMKKQVCQTVRKTKCGMPTGKRKFRQTPAPATSGHITLRRIARDKEGRIDVVYEAEAGTVDECVRALRAIIMGTERI